MLQIREYQTTENNVPYRFRINISLLQFSLDIQWLILEQASKTPFACRTSSPCAHNSMFRLIHIWTSTSG